MRSKAIDYVRQRKSFWSFQQEQRAGSPDFEHDSTESVESLLLKEEFRSKILEAIQGLPEDDRMVVTLKHMEGLSYAEIADITGTTVSAVESRLFRARQALRRKLERILR